MTTWENYLSTRAIEDTAPPISCHSLRYHTVDGVEHADGEDYDVTTNVGVLNTLRACQFADFAGMPPTMVPVPDVVGQTEAAATSAITGAGFTVGTITQASDAVVPIGAVISQSPAGGTPAAGGSAVDLVVSTGP